MQTVAHDRAVADAIDQQARCSPRGTKFVVESSQEPFATIDGAMQATRKSAKSAAKARGITKNEAFKLKEREKTYLVRLNAL